MNDALPIRCPECDALAFFTGADGEPKGCVRCGWAVADCERCGEPTEEGELICEGCCDELDEESGRQHERDHTAGAA